MTRLRSRSIRYLMVSLLTMSLIPWVGGTWMDAPQRPSAEARGAWLQDRVESWPSEADREAFERALAEASSQTWTAPEQFTAQVLRTYEAYAPDGHTAADLLGGHADADATTLAHWLHHQASQWGGTAPAPRFQTAALAVLTIARAALGTALMPPHSEPPAQWTAHAVAPLHTAHVGRWLIRCLVQAAPRAP
ncbi:MAG: hypothetical protein R6U20_00050 [Longimonas sp.]|uniref:hypothetical protein n=1 Tax=Longimonas sp. TaxID=2039626 RepID=UPI003974B3CC